MSIASMLGGLNKEKKQIRKEKTALREIREEKEQEKIKQEKLMAERLLFKTKDGKDSIHDRDRMNIPLVENNWFLRSPRLSYLMPSLSDGYGMVTSGDPEFIKLCKKLQIIPAYILKDTYLDIPEEVVAFGLPVIDFDDTGDSSLILVKMKEFYKHAYKNELPEMVPQENSLIEIEEKNYGMDF